MFRDPRLDMRRPRALYEVFPRNRITTAHVVTGLGQLIAEHFGKETAAAIIARQDERFAWKLRDAPVQFRRRHAAQAQIDGAVDMLRGKFGGRTDVEEDRLFLTQQAARPLGQWNAIEISAKGGEIRTMLNGMPITSVTPDQYAYADYKDGGHIMFQIEGTKMYWRNIRIRVD